MNAEFYSKIGGKMNPRIAVGFEKGIREEASKRGVSMRVRYDNLFDKKQASFISNNESWMPVIEVVILDKASGEKLHNLLKDSELPFTVVYRYGPDGICLIDFRCRSKIRRDQELFSRFLHEVVVDKKFRVWFDDLGKSDGFFGTIKFVDDVSNTVEILEIGFSEGE